MPIRFFYLLFLFPFLISLSGCFKKPKTDYHAVEKIFSVSDSLVIAGKFDSAGKLLLTARPKIDPSDTIICTYYILMTGYRHDLPQYADSALAFFSSDAIIKKYPKKYYEAIANKGEFYFNDKRYYEALQYFYRAKTILKQDDGSQWRLDSEIAQIYHQQKNYIVAARLWVRALSELEQCKTYFSLSRLLFIKQYNLNDIGYSYYKAGMLDSALYYYNKDLSMLKAGESSGKITKEVIRPPLIVIYDNLCGLYLVKGDLVNAAYYESLGLSLPHIDIDGVRIPLYIKQAEIDIKTSRYTDAAQAFEQAKKLLTLYGRDNPVSNQQWNKLYALYLNKMHQPEKSLAYLEEYVHLKDSAEDKSVQLYQVNIVSEFNAINDRQLVAGLKQKARIQQLWLWGTAIIIILGLAIIWLAMRNLKNSRKNQGITASYNQQLEDALMDLDTANKNYFNIMQVMAHDLRNPLSGITGIAKQLKTKLAISAEKHEMLRLIATTADHSLTMINTLLETELNKKKETNLPALNIQTVVQDAVDILRFTAAEKNQTIEFESVDMLFDAKIIYEDLWRVCNNLITNALKYSYDGGIITISMNIDGENIYIAVADKGIGITETERQNMFEHRTPSRKTGTAGEQSFGLGLSIAKQIITKYNGDIICVSKPGVGTIFTVCLPRATS